MTPVALALALVFAAADPVKLDLTKFKAAEGGNAELLKADESENKLSFICGGTIEGTVEVPADGEYTVTVEASNDAAGTEKAKFKLEIGGVVVAKEHELTVDDAKEYTFPAKLKKGSQKVAVTFLNDLYKENEYDRNMYVTAIKLEPKKAK